MILTLKPLICKAIHCRLLLHGRHWLGSLGTAWHRGVVRSVAGGPPGCPRLARSPGKRSPGTPSAPAFEFRENDPGSSPRIELAAYPDRVAFLQVRWVSG